MEIKLKLYTIHIKLLFYDYFKLIDEVIKFNIAEIIFRHTHT